MERRVSRKDAGKEKPKALGSSSSVFFASLYFSFLCAFA
jgi:hypothetical protein